MRGLGQAPGQTLKADHKRGVAVHEPFLAICKVTRRTPWM
jgi:hypothetical protein